jgi:LmbE family N-acetylglucosaminyl deacetylase
MNRAAADPLGTAALGTILGVWGHPDDEGYLSAGIMAAAAARGQRVVCVTATRGEAADPARWPPEELARIREAELAAALEILGVTEHRWLDYPDGGCAAVDVDIAAQRVAAIIDEIDADTVLTFGPDGQTGHPDHIAVCDWSVRAAGRARRAPRVLFATNTPEWAESFMSAAVEHDIMMGGEALPATPHDELAFFVRLDGDLLDRKERAMLAQPSQVADLRAAIGPEVYRELLREESFRLPDERSR